jgi:hypothetical protein
MTTPDEIRRLIESELVEAGEFRGSHGITSENIRRFLVKPYLARFEEPANERRRVELWVVLDECEHDATEGYLVVFNDRTRAFGVASKPSRDRRGTVIGYFPSLIDTLEEM